MSIRHKLRVTVKLKAMMAIYYMDQLKTANVKNRKSMTIRTSLLGMIA